MNQVDFSINTREVRQQIFRRVCFSCPLINNSRWRRKWIWQWQQWFWWWWWQWRRRRHFYDNGCDCKWTQTTQGVHSVKQKSIGLIFRTSRSGSDVRYSCHHNSSRRTFPIFAHSWHFSVYHSLQSVTPHIQGVPGGKVNILEGHSIGMAF